MAEQILSIGGVHINTAQKSVYIKQKKVNLRKKEYDLLEFLAKNKNRALNRFTILEYVWCYGASINTNTLEVHVNNLRKKLHFTEQQFLKTIPGSGYILCDS